MFQEPKNATHSPDQGTSIANPSRLLGRRQLVELSLLLILIGSGIADRVHALMPPDEIVNRRWWVEQPSLVPEGAATGFIMGLLAGMLWVYATRKDGTHLPNALTRLCIGLALGIAAGASAALAADGLLLPSPEKMCASPHIYYAQAPGENGIPSLVIGGFVGLILAAALRFVIAFESRTASGIRCSRWNFLCRSPAFCLLPAAFALCVLGGAIRWYSNPKGTNTVNYYKIHIGMTRQQVEDLLGPNSYRDPGPTRINWCADSDNWGRDEYNVLSITVQFDASDRVQTKHIEWLPNHGLFFDRLRNWLAQLRF
jgi:hypothetical protein